MFCWAHYSQELLIPIENIFSCWIVHISSHMLYNIISKVSISWHVCHFRSLPKRSLQCHNFKPVYKYNTNRYRTSVHYPWGHIDNELQIFVFYYLINKRQWISGRHRTADRRLAKTRRLKVRFWLRAINIFYFFAMVTKRKTKQRWFLATRNVTKVRRKVRNAVIHL